MEPDLRPVDERTLRHALVPAPARRLRKASLQLLALAAVAFAAVSLAPAAPLPVPLLALGVVAWAAYWTGLDRGLEALHRTGAAQAWAGRAAGAEGDAAGMSPGTQDGSGPPS